MKPKPTHPIQAAALACLCALALAAPDKTPAADTPSAGLSKEELIATVEAAIEDLNDNNFHVRESATIRLWMIGDRAKPFVRKAADGGNLEVRSRALRMLSLFKFGIYPDTPEEVVKLINQFRHGGQSDQTNAIQQLYSLGQMATVTKLIRSIDDPNNRKRLVNAVVDELDEKLATKFAEEKYDDVEALLKLAAISDAGLRDLAAFHLHKGSLEDEIRRLLDRDKVEPLTPIEHEQLSWYYRVRGDLGQALASASAADNTELVSEIKIAQGDLLALIKASHNPNDRTIQTYGFKAAAQRLSGDSDGFEATIKTIRKYAADNPGEERQCLEALLINGRIRDAIDIATPGGTDRLQLLIDNGDHARALAELGIEAPQPPYNDWLKSLIEEFGAAETQSGYTAALGKAYTVARLLSGWGEQAEAERIFDALGQVASRKTPDLLPRFIANASVLKLHKVALKYARASLVKEAADAGAGLELPEIDIDAARIRNQVGQRGAEEGLISALYYNQASTASFLWDHFENRFTDDTPLQRLERVETLIAPIPPGVDPASQQAAAVELLGELVPAHGEVINGQDKVELLSKLAELYLRHGDRATAMELYRQSLLLERPDADYANIGYAEMLAEDGKWAEAAKNFKIAAEGARTNPGLLVLYAIALERNGDDDGAAQIIKRARLQALGRPLEHMRIAAAFAEFGEYDRAREASQMALNIATLDDSSVHREAIRLADYLIFKDDARSVIYKERYLIECLKNHVPLPRITNASSIRGTIGATKARIAIAENRPEEAISIIRDLVDRQPSNTSLVEDLYPILVRAGLEKEAEEFYQKLNRYGENALSLFPESAQDLNSNAWLKARCGKDLDTALIRSRRSNELSPDNYAYLDTLAEVHFQQGDRKRAVELSEKAVKLSGSDFLLDHQLQRFKHDQPISELLAE